MCLRLNRLIKGQLPSKLDSPPSVMEIGLAKNADKSDDTVNDCKKRCSSGPPRINPKTIGPDEIFQVSNVNPSTTEGGP